MACVRVGTQATYLYGKNGPHVHIQVHVLEL